MAARETSNILLVFVFCRVGHSRRRRRRRLRRMFVCQWVLQWRHQQTALFEKYVGTVLLGWVTNRRGC
jgi:hypothetical protein